MEPVLLHDALKNANIVFEGCNSGGEVWEQDGTRIQDRPDVAVVVAEFTANPPVEIYVPTIEERLEAAELVLSLLVGE